MTARPRVRHRVVIIGVQVALLVGALGIWQALASTHTIDVFFYGDPAGTWRQLLDWIHGGTTEGPLWQQIWVTLQEALLGFVIGVVLGVVCGIVLGRVKLLSEILAVYIGAFNSIPRIVLGSIFIIWFGLGMQSKIALAVLLIFFNVFFNAFQGAREVDGGLIANAKLLGASRLDVILQVVVPSAFSWIIASLRVAFGLAITGSVVGEMLGAQQGLGTLISQAQGNFNPNGVYAGLVVTTIVALAAEGLITVVERRLLRWRPPRHALEAET
ncbi:MAG TPA: ABC transporter permease [Actinocrinis sp.]|nr:ABC transporter permease [Actinocrinis sp.]